jgi:hypothetical protein
VLGVPIRALDNAPNEHSLLRCAGDGADGDGQVEAGAFLTFVGVGVVGDAGADERE